MDISKKSWLSYNWSKRYIWLNILGVNSQSLLLVSTMSWSSSALPKIPGITDEEAGNLGNVYLCGTILGSSFAFYTLTYLSRKMSLILNEIILLVSWILLFFMSNMTLVYVGRFLAGMGASCIVLNVPVYEAESFHAVDRQLSGGIMCLYTALAFWFEFSVAPFISNENVVIVNLIPVVLFLILFPCLGAESPFHLIKTGHVTEARQVMDFFWSKDSDQQEIDEELERIKVTIEEEREMGVLGAFKTMFTNKVYLKTTLIALILINFFCTTGFIQLSMYMELILIKAQVKQISPSVGSAVIGTVKLIGALLSIPTIKAIGVKKTFLVTLSLNGISMITLGGYFFAKTYTDKLDAVFWLPVTSLAVYFFAALMGSSMFPFLLRGEILPRHLRGPGGATTDILTSAFSVLSNLVYDAFSEKNIYIDFWIFAAITVLNVLFVYNFIPETKNKTLHEIQENLK